MKSSPIVALRKRLKLSQRDFAIMCNMSPVYVAYIEGLTLSVSKKMLNVLSDLGIDTDKLVEEQNKAMANHSQEVLRRAKNALADD